MRYAVSETMRFKTRCLSRETARVGETVAASRLYVKREGTAHTLWINPRNGHIEAVPRHAEIKEPLARKILKNLSAEWI